jgi:methylase of polypeptide subunit release factors
VATGTLETGAALLAALKRAGYNFVTPTPSTHARVLRHPGKTRAHDLRDVFGWSLPFARDLLPIPVLAALQDADGLIDDGSDCRSTFRIASLGQDLFLHSAFPPEGDDAVFFGPDTYRFARLIEETVGGSRFDIMVDVGAGTGAGAVTATRAADVRSVILTDVNPAALDMARANLRGAGVEADFRLAGGLDAVREQADLIIANPPFIDDSGKTYSDGGSMKGAGLSLKWALTGAERLSPKGKLVLYTGSAIVGGVDRLFETLQRKLDGGAFSLSYEELDPDIFGEQVSAPGYEDVERIAAVGAVIARR